MSESHKYYKGYVYQSGELSVFPRSMPPGFRPEYALITADNIDAVTEAVSRTDTISFDTETTSLYIDELVLVSFSFAFDGGNYVCITSHTDASVCYAEYDKVRMLVHTILSRKHLFLFNARFDLRVIDKALDLSFRQYDAIDDQSLVFLSDTNLKMPSLKWSEKFFLGVDAPSFDHTVGDLNIQETDPYKLAQYSAYDSWGTLELGKMFYPELSKRYPLVTHLDRKIIPALMYFENEEFAISREVLLDIQQQASERSKELQELIYDAVGVFLLTSSKQLIAKLVALGYDTGERTKTGQMQVGIDQLRNIQDVDFIEWIIEYKKMAKLLSSYISPMLRRLDLGLPFRFHYILNNAPTMRLAAGAFAKPKKKADQNTHFFVDMNFQSISKPKMVNRRIDWDPQDLRVTYSDTGRYLVEMGSPKLNLRRSFVPPSEDFIYCAIDFAGQELRIAASMSGEPVWIDAFRHGKDIHAETAKKIWGEDNYDKNKRKMAKIANFAILYGGGVYTLMNKLKMSEPDAAQFLKDFKAALPTLFKWIDRVRATARSQGYVLSAYGLPRRLSYFYRQGGGAAGFADRSSVNTQIQGSAGMIIRLALTRLYDRIGSPFPGKCKGDFHGDVFFRGTVHDELDFVVRRSRFREFLDAVIPMMVSTIPKDWPIPMEVEVSVGENWGEMIAIDHLHPDLLPKEVEEHEAVSLAPDDEWASYGFDELEEDEEDE
jgi:DNA polymerase-1